MLEKIIKFCLEQRNTIILISLIVAAAGIYSCLTIPIDAFPDVTNKQVEVVSYAQGLSAMEIERTVTYPIEMAMRGLPKVEQMRSVTKYGISIVTIIFKDNVDIYFARQLVFERLAEAKESVPEGVEIALSPLATVMGEIYQYTLDYKLPQDEIKKVEALTELRTLQEWVVTPLLKNIPGVSEINSFGGYFKEYQVLVNPDKLLKYDLSIQEVYSAVENNNQNVGGNILEKESEKSIIRGIGLIQNTQDIENIVLKALDGTPIYIRDVAEVRIGQAVRQGASIIDGKDECVGGIVMLLRGENSRMVVKRVKEKVAEINQGSLLPSGIKIKPYYDRTTMVEASIKTVTKSLMEGSIFIIIILYLLLRNFRGSVIVLLSLPFSILITFIVLKVLNIEANLMSLGGLAISIGMIIDGTIIQVENVQRHLSEQRDSVPKMNTVIKSVLDVAKPSIFGILIIAITFIPILSLQGIEGKMFSPLAITVAIALFSSLLLSIFVIPILCFKILKPEPEKESIIIRIIKRLYLPLLNRALKSRVYLIGISLVLLMCAILIIPRLGTEFIPIMDEGAFDMDIQLLPTVSLEKAKEINLLAAFELKKFPELETVVGRIGQTGLALDVRGVDKTGYVGIMKPKSEWPDKKMSREKLTEKMRQALEKIPGILFGFSQPIQCRIDETVAGTKAQLIIKLFGDNTEVLEEKGDEIAAVVSKIDGVEDLMAETVAGQSYINIDINRTKIARYGLNINEIQNVIEIAIGGKSATQVYEENKSFDVKIWFQEGKRNSIDAIGNILVTTPAGYSVPLSQLADIEEVEGPLQISRENGQRRMGIEMNIQGRDIGGFVKEAKEKIKNKVELPVGYYLEWGGQFENQERAMKTLMIIMPLCIGLIMFLLYLAFKSLRQAFLILLNLPFALVGGIFALYISGLYLSVPAAIGFIALFGIAVLNGIVLVSYISRLREKEMGVEEAIIKGCENRLRPVLMTTLITIFSLIPMLFATGTGSEIQKPLATVVIGGLITSTLLTLIVLPSLYSWFDV
ncbi:MAG: CusA/CzcA family heavy metal efflux RND transporter, partial [Candidatus Desantisbacteria bacterium]